MPRAFARLGVIWLDAHGDLNTPESSPSGDEWGMPLRMIIDQGMVDAADVVLWGARNLDPPEERVHRPRAGSATTPRGVLERADAVYVALDLDVLDPGEMAVFMPEPDGPSLDDVEQLLVAVRESGKLAGAGFTGLAPDPGERAEAPTAHGCARPVTLDKT